MANRQWVPQPIKIDGLYYNYALMCILYVYYVINVYIYVCNMYVIMYIYVYVYYVYV